MYAIVVSGGKQYKVSEGDTIDVETLPVEAGSAVELNQVLMVSSEQGTTVGAPLVEGASVKATVQRHGRGRKIIVYKHKKNYRRKQGHRQNYTRLRVEKITV
ncbi:MAG: 50S ribosomal protein L21 [Anaerolineae bacterium]